MRKFLMWFLLLNKRLYKKRTFLIILALIPIVVLALGTVSKEDTGMVSIALASEDINDDIYNEIVNDLNDGRSHINFIEYDSQTEAFNAVNKGDVDVAWIFKSDLEGKIQKFSKTFDKNDAVVNVIARDSNVVTQLTLEKLSSTLYKYVSRNFYINYINDRLPELENLTEEELFEYYDDFELSDELFNFSNSQGSNNKETLKPNYITAPIRGLLAIIVVICGFAATMFYIDDDRKGTFSWVKQKNKIFVQFGCVAIAVLNVSIVMLISLFFAGINVTIMRELISMIFFVLCCSVFCVIVSQLCSKIYVIGCFIPITAIIMFVICPVFFDFVEVRKLQILLPPTYYISSAINSHYYLYSVIYIVISFAIMLVINKIKQQKISFK